MSRRTVINCNRCFEPIAQEHQAITLDFEPRQSGPSNKDWCADLKDFCPKCWDALMEFMKNGRPT